jgi:hypothetical protein
MFLFGCKSTDRDFPFAGTASSFGFMIRLSFGLPTTPLKASQKGSLMRGPPISFARLYLFVPMGKTVMGHRSEWDITLAKDAKKSSSLWLDDREQYFLNNHLTLPVLTRGSI